MYINLITRFQSIVSLLGDVSYGFGDDGVVWYEIISELVSKTNGYLLIDTGGVI